MEFTQEACRSGVQDKNMTTSLREKQRRYLGNSLDREVKSGGNRISGVVYADERGLETGTGLLEFRWTVCLEGEDPRSLRSVSLVDYSVNGFNPRTLREEAAASLAFELSRKYGLGIRFKRNPESGLVLARYDSVGEPPEFSSKYLESGAIEVNGSRLTLDFSKIDGDPKDALLEVARLGLETDVYRRKAGIVTLLVKKGEAELSFDHGVVRVDSPRDAVDALICLYNFALDARPYTPPIGTGHTRRETERIREPVGSVTGESIKADREKVETVDKDGREAGRERVREELERLERIDAERRAERLSTEELVRRRYGSG